MSLEAFYLFCYSRTLMRVSNPPNLPKPNNLSKIEKEASLDQTDYIFENH